MKISFWIYSLILMCFVMIGNFGCSDNSSGPGSLESKYSTTLDRTIVPDPVPSVPTVSIEDPANYSSHGYGKWHYGPGLPYQRRVDLMPAGYEKPQNLSSTKLLRFFTMTDVHITDKESPAQAIGLYPFAGPFALSLYSPLMLYTTHVLNAAVQTINGIHKQNPFDLGIAIGDLANSTQYNELRWFIDVMDGRNITPSSGTQVTPLQDFQKQFTAEGLDKTIPWYAAVGNHDHFWLGSRPVNAKIRTTLAGGNILQLGNILTNPGGGLDENTYSAGVFDCSKPFGPIIGMGKVDTMINIPTVSPDANRRPLSKSEFINEFNNTSSNPPGHGFVQSNPQNDFSGCYSFEPKSNVPLKIIVLDDTQDEGEISSGIYGHGSLENGRHEWLIAQLQEGQNNGKLMVIAAHIPIGATPPGSQVGWYNPTVEASLLAELKTFSNLILWVSGHRHLNTITPQKSTDPNHPENSFWVVETKSLREFPQQMRTFDIMLNNDNTISIFTVNVDTDVKEGSMPWISRSYAIAANQIYKVSEEPQPTGSVSYNAELMKVLSPEMVKKLKK
jgi:metallophosphoesterase (TIGR03768 family)